MSFTIPRRARYLTFAGLSTLALAIGAQVAVTPSAVSIETYTVPLHQDPPITNSEYSEQEKDCPGSPAQFGWHFVLPTNDTTFVELTVVFENAGTITIDTFGPPTAKHAYVYTPTDDTLLSASAVVTGGDAEFFNLSHVCAGSGTTPTGTPSVTPSATASETPSATVSATASETPSETVSATPSETVSATASETPSETPSETVSATASETPSATVSATASETPSATVSGVVVTTTAAPTETPSASVSGVVITRTPEESASTTVTPSVQGVRQTRGPAVRGSGLPDTGTPFPVAILLLLGFGLLFGGVVTTVAAEAPGSAYQGRHRR